jgi:BioD-like phosphotransacetylase family protein
VLLIEGTGHAGVGAVIGLSNATVAAAIGAPAIIVSEGGVGRPIDEIVLNASLFASRGVKVAGAIVNKVDIEAQPGIERVLEQGLAPYGIPLLGILPVRPLLSNPTLEMILEGVPGETLHAGPDLERVIDGVAIGAMEPGHMLERVGPGTLVIVPGDREDVILTLTTAHLMGVPRTATDDEIARPTLELPDGHEGAAIGLVLTGGYRPRPAVIAAIRRADLFATLVPDDTYTVASEVHDLLVKTHAADREKVELIKELVSANLDIDRILAVATAWPIA